MKLVKIAVALAAVATTSACALQEPLEGTGPFAMGQIGEDKSIDYGINKHHLSTMIAGVWVDPHGCDHWIIDDGVEGYLSPRLTPDGRPVCSGIAPPNYAVGPFKEGTPIADAL